MLLQAPIFHGHAFSLYLELEQAAQVEELTAALSGDHVDVLQSADESPSNVNAAGQEQIQVFVRRDSQQAERFLAVGRIRQPADRGPDRGGVRREHDRRSSARNGSVTRICKSHVDSVLAGFAMLLLARRVAVTTRAARRSACQPTCTPCMCRRSSTAPRSTASNKPSRKTSFASCAAGPTIAW